MQENSGISEKFSDFVGNIKIQPSSNVKISSTFRLDQKKFSLKNAYTSLFFKVNKNQLSISNIHSPVILDETGATEIEGKNQYSISYNHKLVNSGPLPHPQHLIKRIKLNTIILTQK